MRLIHPVSMSLSVQMFFELSTRRGYLPAGATVRDAKAAAIESAIRNGLLDGDRCGRRVPSCKHPAYPRRATTVIIPAPTIAREHRPDTELSGVSTERYSERVLSRHPPSVRQTIHFHTCRSSGVPDGCTCGTCMSNRPTAQMLRNQDGRRRITFRTRCHI